MFTIKEKRKTIIELLNALLKEPQMRSFLFRTRFERAMIKTKVLAQETNDCVLENCANDSLLKIRSIVDKSNNTSDGILRSFVILEPDIKKIIKILEA